MKLKFIGYAVPPFPMIAIAPSVYSDGTRYFFSYAVDYCIKEFLLLSRDNPIEKILTDKTIYKQVGDPEFYVFYNPEVKNLVGEFTQIKDDLQSLLNEERFNVHAKLEIALFLKQKNKVMELLLDIPDDFGFCHQQIIDSVSSFND